MKRFIFLLSVPLLAVSAAAQQADNAAQPQDAQAQIDALSSRVAALEGAPLPTTIATFNPAIGMALDSVFVQAGPNAGFQLRAAELGIEAPVDPYLTASAIITGSNSGIDVENAEMQTTSLPYNLTVRGGRMFASFGRLPHFHDHELPMVERPNSIDTYIGGESQADGLEVSWLFPTDAYINATFGAYNKLGADNARVDNAGTRRMSEFTYLGRLNTYADISDNQSLELGVSSAFTPRRVVSSGGNGTWRTLNGVDLTYRYQPANGGIYKGLLWGTEVLQNDEMRLNPTSMAQLGRKTAYAGYTYIQMKAGRHWVPGAMLDLTENPDDPSMLTRTAEAFVQYDVTEFQALRLAYSYAASNTAAPDNHTLMLQWTAVIGHHVHGFDMRSL
jgi:hypothetical protein